MNHWITQAIVTGMVLLASPANSTFADKPKPRLPELVGERRLVFVDQVNTYVAEVCPEATSIRVHFATVHTTLTSDAAVVTYSCKDTNVALVFYSEKGKWLPLNEEFSE